MPMKKRPAAKPKPRLRKPDRDVKSTPKPAFEEPVTFVPDPSHPAVPDVPQVPSPPATSESPNTPDLTPAGDDRRGYEMITDFSVNRCRLHGDNAKVPVYTAVTAHAGREPNGTCNNCWNFFEAVRLHKESQKADVRSEPMGAARATSRNK